MKLQLRFFALILIPVSSVWGKTYHTSQSFLQTRPIYHNQAALNEWAHIRAVKSECSTGSWLILPMFQSSNEPCNDKNITSYFLLNCKPKILIAGDNTPQANDRDVRAEWLNLPSDFVGTMTLEPEQKQAGIMFALNKDLKEWITWEVFKSWWIEFQLPFVYQQNNLGLKQITATKVPSSFEGPKNLYEAFAQSEWDFAKMDNCSRRKIGFAEFRLIAGATYKTCNDFLFAYTGTFSIPMSTRANPDYLFTPTLGGNGHCEIGLELNFELPLHEKDAYGKCLLFFNVQDHYYLPRHQWRTLDLQKKQWSRYLLLRKENSETTIPAVNIFTQRVRVRPFNTVDLSTGLRIESTCTHLELGYNLWGHSSQHLEFTEPWCEKTPGIITQYGIAGTGTSSASTSTISKQGVNDSVFVHLKTSDLDLDSGASKEGFTSKIHVSFTHNNAVTFGGFYEWAHTNTSLENWGFWASIMHLF